MIANATSQNPDKTYDYIEVGFIGDYAEKTKSGSITYEDEYGAFQTLALVPFPDPIHVRKGTAICVRGEFDASETGLYNGSYPVSPVFQASYSMWGMYRMNEFSSDSKIYLKLTYESM